MTAAETIAVPASQRRTLVAAGFILVYALVIGFTDNFVQTIARDGGLWQFHATRTAFACLILAALAAPLGLNLWPRRPRAVLARSLIHGTGMVIYFGCLAFLSVAEVAAGLFTGWRWFCYVVGTLTLALVAIQIWFFAHIVWWRFVNPWETAFMADRLDELRTADPKAKLRHQWIDYPRISVHLKRAVIVAEDAKFADHEGFDLEGISRALERNKKQGAPVAGGSTITQQLAKNLFLSGERSYVRKAQEAVITVMLESVLGKARIFELYLNVAEWGEGVFGCEAGAQHYYKTSCGQLGPEQAARMAGMLPRPRFYDRNRNTGYLAVYSARILARMPQAQLP